MDTPTGLLTAEVATSEHEIAHNKTKVREYIEASLYHTLMKKISTVLTDHRWYTMKIGTPYSIDQTSDDHLQGINYRRIEALILLENWNDAEVGEYSTINHAPFDIERFYNTTGYRDVRFALPERDKEFEICRFAFRLEWEVMALKRSR